MKSTLKKNSKIWNLWDWFQIYRRQWWTEGEIELNIRNAPQFYGTLSTASRNVRRLAAGGHLQSRCRGKIKEWKFKP